MAYQHIVVPREGRTIRINPDLSLTVPDQPVIPFI
jgi:isocitrate dehydrogenase